MGCQLISGDSRPVLPKPGQAAISTPLTTEILEAVTQRSGGSWWCRLEDFKPLQTSTLGIWSHGHGQSVGVNGQDLATLSQDP